MRDMRHVVDDVKAFTKAAGAPAPATLDLSPSADLVEFRSSLIREEVVTETLAALEELHEEVSGEDGPPSEAIIKTAMVRIADGIADSIYVLVGTAVALGIDLESCWNEVQRSNMDKFAGNVRRREDGKVLKPPGWRPPNIRRALGLEETD